MDSEQQRRQRRRGRCILLCLVGATLLGVSLFVGAPDHHGLFRRAQGRRNLRFFDPDHRTCGSLIEEQTFDQRKLQHHFAAACMFGAKEREYYLQTTVTTDVELQPDKHKMNQILQALSHVAKKTKRAIRINMKLQRGYNHEHIQPYSLVNVVALDKIGVNVVEPGYWRRAIVAQKLMGVRELSTATLTWDQALLNTSDSDEIVLSLEELLDLDNAMIGTLVGPEGGYDHGDWVQPFACMKEHPNPIAIAPQNDPLSPP